MTEKLYYQDAYLHGFEAVVTACEPMKNGFAVQLDRTAFFPEGGGQPADSGRIGEARVRDVHEKDGRILHYVNQPLPVGSRADCAIDWEQRRRRMQNHSGEHVFSGTVHQLYGLNNVGFHMGEGCMTVDFDGELSVAELEAAESAANETLREDLPIRVSRAWISAPAARPMCAAPGRSGSSSSSPPSGTGAACASSSCAGWTRWTITAAVRPRALPSPVC